MSSMMSVGRQPLPPYVRRPRRPSRRRAEGDIGFDIPGQVSGQLMVTRSYHDSDDLGQWSTPDPTSGAGQVPPSSPQPPPNIPRPRKPSESSSGQRGRGPAGPGRPGSTLLVVVGWVTAPVVLVLIVLWLFAGAFAALLIHSVPSAESTGTLSTIMVIGATATVVGFFAVLGATIVEMRCRAAFHRGRRAAVSTVVNWLAYGVGVALGCSPTVAVLLWIMAVAAAGS